MQAYIDCRQSKRNTASALAFEQNLESNLCDLNDELKNGTYHPGRSICFVITRPKPREVWAADFRDRIVRKLLAKRVAEPWWMQLSDTILSNLPFVGFLENKLKIRLLISEIGNTMLLQFAIGAN